MPQMMPLMWTLMLIFLSINLLCTSSFLYFFSMLPQLHKSTPNNSTKKLYWNWTW